MSNSSIDLKVERQKTTLRELTLEKVRSAIFSQYFKPGERLVERTLCEKLGVSRTVVREVLRHLETEGLVETIMHQGPTVAIIDHDTTRQIYEMRALLEGHAAAACAKRADPEGIAQMSASILLIEAAFSAGKHDVVMKETHHFYHTMFHSAGETVAWAIVNSLNARINRLRVITISSTARGQKAPHEMHEILSAIKNKDQEKAKLAAQNHVLAAQKIALQTLLLSDTKTAENK